MWWYSGEHVYTTWCLFFTSSFIVLYQMSYIVHHQISGGWCHTSCPVYQNVLSCVSRCLVFFINCLVYRRHQHTPETAAAMQCHVSRIYFLYQTSWWDRLERSVCDFNGNMSILPMTSVTQCLNGCDKQLDRYTKQPRYILKSIQFRVF